MRTRITALATTLAASSAALLTTIPANAVNHPPTPTHSAGEAGYQVTGRWFRYVSTTFALPTGAACVNEATVSPQGFGAAVLLQAGNTDFAWFGVSAVPSVDGCGIYSPSFASSVGGQVAQQWNPATNPSLAAGDVITLSLYYQQANDTTMASLTDVTHGFTLTSSFEAAEVYTTGLVSAGFAAAPDPSSAPGVWVAPGSATQLFQFKGTRVTTYTGARGSLTGPWTTSEVIMSAGASASGTVEADSPVLWGAGQRFSVWLRPAPVT